MLANQASIDSIDQSYNDEMLSRRMDCCGGNVDAADAKQAEGASIVSLGLHLSQAVMLECTGFH